MGRTLMEMPHSKETEAATLGGLLLNPAGRAGIGIRLSSQSFYSEAHRHIFTAIMESEPDYDFLAVTNTLRRKGNLEKAGGPQYLANLVMNIGTSAGLNNYVSELVNLQKERMLISACQKVEGQARAGNPLPDELIADLRASLREIEATGGTPETPTNRDILNAVLNDIESRAETGQRNVGILAGIDAIDSNTMGFERKSLVYVIGRPSMGKTALAVNMMLNMAGMGGGLVVFFSLEMSTEALTRRMLAAESGIYLSRIRSGDLADAQYDGLLKAMNTLHGKDFFILDHPKWKAVELLSAKAEQLAAKSKLAAIFIDHVQLMRSNQKFGNRHLEVSYISNELKAIAKALDVPVIALSQLNRKIEERTIKKPVLSDMKESGDLEQDVDIALSIYRENPKAEIMEIGCLKGRDTGTWKGQVHFDGFTQKIRDLRPGEFENVE